MTRTNRAVVGIAGTATVVATWGLAATAAPSAQADPGPKSTTDAPSASTPDKSQSHNRFDPLAALRSQQRQEAVDQLVAGDATLKGRGADRTIKTAQGASIDYPVSQTAQLLTFLVDFGDGATNPAYADETEGPVAGDIPEPARSDNSTYWVPTFDREHYLDMFFKGLPGQGGESFKDVYKEMSDGRFDLEGDVSDWVTVPNPEAYYQSSTGDEDQTSMTKYVGDTADAWYDAQKAAGKSDADIVAYLKKFDVWDRYDYDGDGDYNEPDGYIDHFQAIHAGEGEEAGAAPWTIWSHRWAAGQGLDVGPTVDGVENKIGGVEIGDTGYFIRDYTTEPENGGLGVFAHEFGHDLGLPDYYDTKNGDNGTSFWTLMSSGSWNSHGEDAIGTTPNHMDAVSKLFLGWIAGKDLKTVDGTATAAQQVVLGPSEHATDLGAQAVVVNVPPGTQTLNAMTADAGSHHDLYSGPNDNMVVTATSPQVAVPTGSASLSARVSYDLEKDFDYAYLQVSEDGNAWTNVATSKSTTTNPWGANEGQGITNCSGTGTGAGTGANVCTPAWVDLTADLSAYAGKTVKMRWMVTNDENTHGVGFSVDTIKLNGTLISDFEGGLGGWTLDGFSLTDDGKYDKQYARYYVAENKQYTGYDKTLKTGPYNFDYAVTAPNKVDHFPYQDGLLIWYRNGLYSDNNTITHPGGGQALPVDANAKYGYWMNGANPGPGTTKYAGSKLQAYDATFDVDQTDALSLKREDSVNGTQSYDAPARPGVSVFNDSDPNAYYDATDARTKWYSTQVAGVGAQIQVVSSDESTGRMELKIGKTFVAASQAPAIAGTPTVGQTLTAAAPVFTQPGVAVTYQWQVDGQPVAGATGMTYQVRPADAGKRVTVVATGAKTGFENGSVSSAQTEPVKPAATTLSVKAPKKTKVGQKVKIKVEVGAAGVVPTGKVKVSLGGKSVTAKVVNGKVKVMLPKQTKTGTKRLVVTFVPDTGFAVSSDKMKITVKKKR